MTPLILGVAIPLAYFAGMLITARRFYAKRRPNRVPSCGMRDGHALRDAGLYSSLYKTDKHGHYTYKYDGVNCYGDYGDDSLPVVLALSAGVGLAWPFLVPVLLLAAAITVHQKERPEEAEARLRAAEKALAEATEELRRRGLA